MKKKRINAVLAAVLIMSNLVPTYAEESWILGGGGKHSCDYDNVSYKMEDKKRIIKTKTCDCGDDISETEYTFKSPKAILDINSVKKPGKTEELEVVDDGRVYFEQGVVLKHKANYEFNKSEGDDGTVKYGGKSWTDIVDYELKLNGKKISDNSKFELPEDLGMCTLELTVSNEYPNEKNSMELPFYIGPYPTIYYNAILEDENKDSHCDTLSLKNIEMTCTYKPQSITFELYNDNGRVWEFSPTLDATVQPRSDNLGWKVTFLDYTQKLGINIDPTLNYYLKVLVNDERKGTPEPIKIGADYAALTPEAPKYAKFGSV